MTVGIGSLVFALGVATTSAINEWENCKWKLSASVFDEFINALTRGLMSTVIGKIITLTVSSKNISEFVKGLIEGLT